jgi:hypothetical protein
MYGKGKAHEEKLKNKEKPNLIRKRNQVKKKKMIFEILSYIKFITFLKSCLIQMPH